MLSLVVALSGPPSVSFQPAPVWLNAGSVYRSAATHVGVRPAVVVARDEIDLGLTVQITARAITL